MSITTALIKQLREATGAGPMDCKRALEANAGSLEKATDYLRERGLARAAKKAGRETNCGLVVVKTSGDSTGAVEVRCETDFVAFTAVFKTFVNRLADQVLADASLTDAEKLLAADFIDTPGKTTADVLQELIGRLGENMILRRVERYTASGTNLLEGYIHAGDVEGHYGPTEGRVGVLVDLEVNGAVDNAAVRELNHDLALHIAALSPVYVSPEAIPGDVLQAERDRLIALLADENKPDTIKAKIVEGRLDKFLQQTCLLKQTFVKDDDLTMEEFLRRKSKEIGAAVRINRFARFEVGA